MDILLDVKTFLSCQVYVETKECVGYLQESEANDPEEDLSRQQ